MCYTPAKPTQSTEACTPHGSHILHQIIITPFSSHAVSTPGVTVPCVNSSQVEYETTAHGSATRVIAGYEVIRFGVPMIGQYMNTGRGRRVTITPAVPGAQYRITAWALGDGMRSATPAVVDATTEEGGEIFHTSISRPSIAHRDVQTLPDDVKCVGKLNHKRSVLR